MSRLGASSPPTNYGINGGEDEEEGSIVRGYISLREACLHEDLVICIVGWTACSCGLILLASWLAYQHYFDF